jgi:ribosomal protein S12
MSTANQLTKNPRPKRIKKTKYYLFKKRPQKKVTFLQALEMAPRKPHSAKRNIANVFWWQRPK